MKENKFKIGDIVSVKNSYGIVFGIKTITGMESWYKNDCRYFLTPTDTPWLSHDEENLKLAVNK